MSDDDRRYKPTDVMFETDYDEKELVQAGHRNKQKNQAHFQEQAKYVWHLGKQELVNPEYAARARETKALRQKLKIYSGSPEVASDMMFEIKKKADAAGQDFTEAARNSVAQMQGKGVAEPDSIPQLKIEEPKKPLAGRIIHWLWKKGFPVQMFIKKELDVDEANK